MSSPDDSDYGDVGATIGGGGSGDDWGGSSGSGGSVTNVLSSLTKSADKGGSSIDVLRSVASAITALAGLGTEITKAVEGKPSRVGKLISPKFRKGK